MKQKLLALARIILGLTFVFSGFVKAVDPWGGSIKIVEYFNTFGLYWLKPLSFPVAISLSSIELALGLMLIFGLRKKKTALFSLVFMSFFTLLTLYIAIANPVADCGCFGDAIKLSAWETFFKNLIILWPLSIYVFSQTKKIQFTKCQNRVKQNIIGCCFVLIGLIINVEALIFLPSLDFRPYKIGTDLSNASTVEDAGEIETILIYKNKENGEEHKFSLTDTTWYNENKWEYIDTQIITSGKLADNSTNDFIIYNHNENISSDLLAMDDLIIISITDINDIKESCISRLDKYLSESVPQANVVIVTPTSNSPLFYAIGENEFPVYSIDATTLKTIIRAKNGVIRLNRGVIIDKSNCLVL